MIKTISIVTMNKLLHRESRCGRLFACVVLFVFWFGHTNSQVILNEIYIRPDGSSNTPPNGLIYQDSKEYIELYNKGCSPVNVSGYFLAMKQQGFGTIVSGGTIRIPSVAASIIPPGGHLVLGSALPGSGVAGNIDIAITAAMRCGYSANFVLPNVDGWVALYDSSGTPLDCVYWSGASGNINSQPSDFNPPGVLCLPTGSPAVTLSTAQQIFQTNPGIVSYISNSTPIIAYRQQDGSPNWLFAATYNAGTLPWTINKSLANGNCNGGTCVQVSSIQFSASATNPSCGNNNGSISINVTSSGTASYVWSANANAGNIANALNLAAGTYSVSVTQNGCIKDTTITLSGSGTPLFNLNVTRPACNQSNGSISIVVSTSGTATYAWSANASTGNSATASGLSAGLYSVTVTQNGCTKDTSLVLSSINGPAIDSIISVPESCPGSGDGSITIYASGGSGTLTYQWSTNANTGNQAKANNLVAGTYGYTVQDGNNCQTSGTAVVNSGTCCNLQTTAVAQPSTCNLNNGVITVTVLSGGQPNYSYSIAGSSSQSSNQFSNLAPGNYNIVTMDANNCRDTTTVVVSAIPNLLNVVVNTTDVSCYGASDGSASAVVSGGVGTVTFQWNNSSTSSTIQALTPGSYSVVVRDSNNCSATATGSVAEPPRVLFDLGADRGLCDSASFTISGPPGFSTYFWSTGENTASITASSAGTYILTVTNANGCQGFDSITVRYGSSATIDLGPDQIIYSGSSISLSPSITGSLGGNYNWSPDYFLSCTACAMTVASPDRDTEYFLTYIDPNGCSVVDSIMITVLPLGNIFFPSAFSPNEDGNNDIFRGLGGPVKYYDLKIFNRWGELVFQTNNFNDGWDGSYQTVPQPVGAYVYLASVTLNNNQSRVYKGNLTLLR